MNPCNQIRNQSEQINELATALAKCQAEMNFAIKDSVNPAFRSKYADLSAVWEAIRQPLTKNGLAVVQTIDLMDGKTVLISTLMHVSGQWIRSCLPIKTDKDTCQGWGSGITYARRYALAALVGCVQDDDDGNGAMPNGNHLKPKQETKQDEKKESTEKKNDSQFISQSELNQITNLMSSCDPDYVNTVMKYLKTEKGIDNMKNLDKFLFPKILKSMKDNADIYSGRFKIPNV
jgi:hypothetical protein